MAISTVYIYNCPTQQYYNRQFVLQPSTVSTLLSTNTGIKNTGDTVQEIHIPYSANNANANIMKIDTRYYDIIKVDNTTFKDTSTIYTIVLNPVSSFMIGNSTVAGVWDRTPTNKLLSGHVNIADDMLATSRTVALPKLVDYATNFDVFYYQITTKCKISWNGSSVTILDNDGLYQYGGLACWDENFWTNSTYGNISTSSAHSFISLAELINNIDTSAGFPSDSIIDVSVSRRCPWKTTLSSNYYNLYSGTNPVALTTGTLVNGVEVGTVRINGSNLSYATERTTAATITLTDYERYCGEVDVCDELGNTIFIIPNEYFDSNNQLTYYCYGSSDLSGLYTHFKFLDTIVIIPEGKLPWIGDAWADYKSRTMDFDRAELSLSITKAKQAEGVARTNALMSSVSTGAMGALKGGPTGAALAVGSAASQAGLSYMAAAAERRNAIMNLKAEQKNRENYVKQAVSNNFNTSYGLDYLNRSIQLGGACIKIKTPKNHTSTDFTNYVAYNGYPCNKYASFPLVSGYYKGNLYTSYSYNGEIMNMLLKEFEEGCKIITS